MRQMKDSGIEWIGEIPQDWAISNIKSKFVFGKGLPITKDNLVSKGSPVISYGQIHSKSNPGTKVTSDLIRYVNESEWTSYKNAVATRGNFVFADTSEDYAGCGNCTYIDTDEKIFAGYHTILLKSKDIDNKYYAYLFLTDGWRKQIREKCAGVKLFSITQRNLKSAIIINPPFDEQQKIADYLDKKCTEIDNAISKTTASIEEYKKLKQAIITKAVTKGIRGNRPMKDSGIEWIGEMPADWELIPFRRVLRERQEKNCPVKSKERLSLSIDLGVTLYSEKTTNLDRFKDDFEQYKLAHKGDLVMNSMNMIVGASGVSDYYGCVSPVYYTYYDNEADHCTAKFCEYIFRSKTLLRVLYSLGKGIYAIVRGDDRVNTCRLKVSKEDLKSLKLPIPSFTEQREIIAYINDKSNVIDEIIAKKQQLITELEAYKKSLIYEYVTGKKEVV